MGEVLYRKYRPTSLAGVIGQEHVTTTLANALKTDRMSHAYLLSGPRGTGKTSIARILAHEINSLPYTNEPHLDIIEIDAASNRRIDEIRDIRDRVHTAPAEAKYKVYIIDEVHMLTKEAFNALLKTLEEPPEHVVFILATTEPHKLPGTIVSRTQRYTLRPVALDKVVAHLGDIAKAEKLKIDDDALELIAAHGEGCFRDSISLLDQASSAADHITRVDIEQLLGLAPGEYLTRLAGAMASGDSATIVTTLTELYALGFEPGVIARQLGDRIRQEVLDGTAADPQNALQLLQRLLDISAARSPKQLLELVLLQIALPSQTASKPVAAPQTQSVVSTPAQQPSPQTVHTHAKAPQTKTVPTSEEPADPLPDVASEKDIPKDSPKQPAETDAATTNGPIQAEDVTELWNQTLEAIKKQHNTLYGIARMAQPTFDGVRLTLAFKFAFHQKRMNEAKNRQIFTDTVERLSSKPIEIICVLADSSEAIADKPDVTTISNIFGSAELLP